MAKSRDQIWEEWQRLVNLPATELSDWLGTAQSRSVGQKDGGGESVGHRSGRQILGILERPRPELTDEDWHHMGRVVGYIKRHRAQGGPRGDVSQSRWRYSLMNWGHDPLL